MTTDFRKSAFTLIEILIVIAVLAVLFSIASPIYGNFLANSQSREATDLLVQDLRHTRERSIAGYRNSAHGLKLFSDSYVIYQGDTYDSRASIYDRLVELSDALTIIWTNSDDINFSKALGNYDATSSIDIIHRTGITKEIIINIQGIIDYND